jgi:hypothetical protein
MTSRSEADGNRRYAGAERRWRIGLTVILAAYGAQILRTPGIYRWLDSLDLAIHEAGHLVFAVGGEFLGLFGGTLAQLLIPVAFLAALWRQGDRHGATVPLWWLGQNCTNIAIYIKDARVQELPLVGGGEHDWFLLLDQFGMLESELAIGRAVTAAGAVCFGTPVILGWRLLGAKEQRSPAELASSATRAL